MLVRLIHWLLTLLGLLRDANADGGPSSSGEARSRPLPKVIVNKKFVSDAEQRLYHTLCRVLGPDAHVLVQVALNRLLWFPPNQDRSTLAHWQNKVARRSLDYVVCDPKTLRPLFALELDDASHRAEARERRDDEVQRICEAAGLRLVRVPSSVMVDELRALIGEWRAR